MSSWRYRTTIIGSVFAVATISAFASVARAQALVYSYRGGDTARFAEVITVDINSRGPAGSVTAAFKRDSRIFLAFIKPDSVRAWYDAISIDASGPDGKRDVDASPVLRQPFMLRVKPDGGIRTLVAPVLPQSVRDRGQFNPYFDDFLQLLPARVTAGTARVDTITRTESDANGRRSTMRRIVKSKVERDTVFDGTAATVVSTQVNIRVQRSTPMSTGAFVTDLELNGTETGIAVISRDGRLLRRQRAGDLSGHISYKNAGTDVSVPQHYRYRATLTAMRS